MLFIFLQFYLTSLRGKDYFGPLEPEPEPLEKKYQEPEPLGKKSGAGAGAAKKKAVVAGAAKKFAGSPALLKTICN